MPWTYMLRCADGTYYVGSCRDLDHRMSQHAAGVGSEYTRRRLPVELVWREEVENVAVAFALEKQIQNWSRRKREALIAGDWGDLSDAAKKRRPRAPG